MIKGVMTGVTVTGNFLRPGGVNRRGTHDVDIDWFFFLLRPALSSLFPRESIQTVTSKDMPVDEIYAAMGLEYNAYSYAKLHAGNDGYADILEGFLDRYNDNLIVGFELPPILKVAFQKRGSKYIDLIIHHIRFCDDLVLAAVSNDEQIYKKIRYLETDAKKFWAAADYVQANLCRKPVLDIEQDAAVFIGQKMLDTALIYNSSFLDEDLTIQSVTELCSKYSTVYYKPHPYKNPEAEGRIATSFSQLLNLKYLNDNIYKILFSCKERNGRIYALTSSVIQEAKYFDVLSYRIGPEQKTIVPDIGSYVAIDRDALYTDFWSRVLERPSLDVGVSLVPDGVLKKTIELAWGMDDLFNS